MTTTDSLPDFLQWGPPAGYVASYLRDLLREHKTNVVVRDEHVVNTLLDPFSDDLSHLVVEQKQKSPRAIAAIRICNAIRNNWMLPDRQIAKLADTTHKTVAKYRERLEKDSEIGQGPKVSTSPRLVCTEVDTFALHDVPENFGLIYDPIRDDDPEYVSFVANIAKNGILEPLVSTADGFVVSGHRRLAAAKKLKLKTVPVRVRDDLRYCDDPERVTKLAVSHNKHREKTTNTMVREGIVEMDGQPRQAVKKYRHNASQVDSSKAIKLRGKKKRSRITQKISLMNAIRENVYEREDEWPMSDRRVNYLLLNIPGLLRNDVLKSPFENNEGCYKDVCNMITRMRLNGMIPFAAISDETRPVIQWNTHRSVRTFVDKELGELFDNYFRDLLQSQPNHIELLVEKNTVATLLNCIASKYTIPMTSGRGYSSLPPRKDMVDRFRNSGREKLVIIVVSDCDPEGFDIPNSFGLSLRDDFDVDSDDLVVVQAALTFEQAQSLDLHEGQFAKKKSSRFEAYKSRFGERCWELEAVDTAVLRGMVESAIRDVLDVDAFEKEVSREQSEQDELNGHRERVKALLIESMKDK